MLPLQEESSEGRSALAGLTQVFHLWWRSPDYSKLRGFSARGEGPMDQYATMFDGRTKADWLREAAKFLQMAERCSHNPVLCKNFQTLASNARGNARLARGGQDRESTA
jgi:hypothetical protein